MQRYMLTVFSNPATGQDDAYNDWYDNTHLADVLSIPGFVKAQRFRTVDGHGLPGQITEHAYLATYEIATENLPELLAELLRRTGTAQMRMSPAFDMDSVRLHVSEVL